MWVARIVQFDDFVLGQRLKFLYRLLPPSDFFRVTAARLFALFS